MILSQTAIYALRAALYLAEARGGEPVRVDEMASNLDVPRNYLSKILHVLAKAGLLDSTRGPKGGFVLVAPPSEVALADVIRHFDTITESSGCLLGRAECLDSNPCAVHDRWRDVSARVRAFLAETTLESLHGSGHTPGVAPAAPG